MLTFGDKLLTQNTKQSRPNTSKKSQKLKQLSQQEKILLIELQQTRNNILSELQKLNSPQRKSSYSQSHKFDIVNDNSSIRNSILADSRELYSRGSRTLQLTANSEFNKSRNQSRSNTAQQISYKSTVDTLPIVSPSVLIGSSLKINNTSKSVPIKLPIFQLPSIKINTFINNKNNYNDYPYIQLIGNRNKLPEILLHLINKLQPKEIDFFNNYLQINITDIEYFKLLLQKKSNNFDIDLYKLENSEESIFNNVNKYYSNTLGNTFVNFLQECNDNLTNNNSNNNDDEIESISSTLSSPSLYNYNHNRHSSSTNNLLSSANNFTYQNKSQSHKKKTTKQETFTGSNYSNGDKSPQSLMTLTTPTITIPAAFSTTNILSPTLRSPSSPSRNNYFPELNSNNNNNVSLSSSFYNNYQNIQSAKQNKKRKQKALLSNSLPISATSSVLNKTDVLKNRTGFPDVHADSSTLRAELLTSLQQMKLHTDLIKESILKVPEVAKIDNPKNIAFLLSLSAEKMQAALLKIIHHELQRGLRGWLLFLKQEKMLHLYQSFIKCLLLRNIALILHTCATRMIRRSLSNWLEFTKYENIRRQNQYQMDAAIVIQKYIRGMIARHYVQQLQEKIKYKRLFEATVRIQAFMRGKVYRMRYLRRTQLLRELHSVLLLQRVERGRKGRKRAKFERKRRDKNLSAARIQGMIRARLARSKVRMMRQEKLERISATKLQALVRGFVSRAQAARIQRHYEEVLASIAIQAVIRGVLSRLHLNRKLREIADYKASRMQAAKKIQSLYRGHRGRVMTKMRMVERIKKMKRLNRAALKIQGMFRIYAAKSRATKLREERYKQWLTNARAYQEMWSEDAGTWFYLHVDTGVAAWEPTRDGYTKADGRLVLANGDVIIDPINELKGNKNNADKVCSECNDRIAIRKCNECGDNYCTKCFKSAHLTGSRKKHTWEPCGPIDCSECELKLAERWCISCDEAFCDGCWRKVHSKGKRRFHPYSDVDEEGIVDPRIFTIDGEQLMDYNSAYAQQRLETEQDAASLATASASTADWADVSYFNDASTYQQAPGGTAGGEDYAYNSQTFGDSNSVATFDNSVSNNPTNDFVAVTNDNNNGGWCQAYDDQGYAYWYNTITGVSQYEDPFATF